MVTLLALGGSTIVRPQGAFVVLVDALSRDSRTRKAGPPLYLDVDNRSVGLRTVEGNDPLKCVLQVVHIQLAEASWTGNEQRLDWAGVLARKRHIDRIGTYCHFRFCCL